jgi:cell shape-determining protein MreD
MLFYLLLPFLSVLLVVIQTTIADMLFSGRLVIEISLIVVIYAGFRFDLIRGTAFSFILGFIFDCIAGSVVGLFTFIYVVIFLCSFVASFLMDTKKMYLVAFFCFFCAVLEETIVTLFYKFILNFDIFASVFFVFLPQALVVGLLAPVFFYLMYRVEVFFYGRPFYRAERDGSIRIAAKI